MVSRKNNKRLMSFKVGGQVSLMCKFPGVKVPIKITAIVKNVRSSGYESSVGLLFHEDTTSVTKKVIKWYLSTVEQFIPDNEIDKTTVVL